MAVSHCGVVRVGCIGCRQMACNPHFVACPLSKTAVGIWWLQDLSNQPLQLCGHSKIVTCICFGNKQQPLLLCTASEDCIYIWDVTKEYNSYCSGCHDPLKPLCVGKELGIVQHISFNSADILIAVCIGKEVWVLNIENCKLDSVLEGHMGQLTQAEFCPWDEFVIVSIAEDRTFKVWDIQNSSLLYRSPIISGFPFVSLAFDPVQHCIALGATDGMVRIYDLKQDGAFRCLHEMDMCQKIQKLEESKPVQSPDLPTKGPVVISSQPSWQNPEVKPDLEGDETFNEPDTQAGTTVMGLCFMRMTTPQTAVNSEMAKLPFLNTTQVNDIFHVPSILVVGMTASIILVNCNTWDPLHILDFKDPILSRNELDCTQYNLSTAGSYAFAQSKKNSVHCFVGSLFHNAAHIIDIEVPTGSEDKKTIDVLSSRLSQSVGLNTQGVCTTDKHQDERPLVAAESDQSIITVLSSAPLCANSPLKAELVPKAQTSASKKIIKKVNSKGKTQDQPLTFKSKVKSSGYGDAPRSTMFSPKTNASKKTSVSLKKHSSSSSTSVTSAVVKEYPMECNPPTSLRDKVTLTRQPTAVNCVTYSGNGKDVACALANKSAHLLRIPVTSSSKETVLTGHDGSLTHVQFNHDDKWLLSSSTDRTVRLWSPSLSDPLLVFNSVNHNFNTSDSGTQAKDKDNPPFPKEITHASFYYLDKFVLISSGNGLYMYKYHIDPNKDDIKRYQSNSKYKLVELFHQERAQNITCFSCVNSFHSYIVICCGSNKSIEVFDMNVGRSVRVLMDAHTRPVHAVCQNQGSAYASHSAEAYDLFLTAAVTDGIRLWDLRTNRCVRRYEGHVNRSHPTGLAISPCSRYIATGSEDRSVYLFDVRGTSFCHRLTGHTDVVSNVAFHPAKCELAAASLDGKLKFYTEEIR